MLAEPTTPSVASVKSANGEKASFLFVLSSPTEVLFVKSAAKSLICKEIDLFFTNITYFLELNRCRAFGSRVDLHLRTLGSLRTSTVMANV